MIGTSVPGVMLKFSNEGSHPSTPSNSAGMEVIRVFATT
jgi:hypothetical protein